MRACSLNIAHLVQNGYDLAELLSKVSCQIFTVLVPFYALMIGNDIQPVKTCTNYTNGSCLDQVKEEG